ncbi:MAG: hypothetical protein KBT14_00155 [Proteobacteria bacterium]|nr:hypothetical protein [Candidatus Enterousia onthequi]
MCGIDYKSEKSVQENRALATMPKIVKDRSVNKQFGTEFNSWFSDRFFGRGVLLKISNIVHKTVSVQSTDKVLVQKDGWLFYKLDNSLRNYANVDLLSEQQLQTIATYLKDIDDWCKRYNKQFVYVVAPDKNKIYGEYIIDVKKINPDSNSRANQLVEYLHKNTKVKVVYPYNDLINKKDKMLLYFKNDTHWNSMGAYIGYTAIMKTLHVKPIDLRKTKEITNVKGDLTNMSSTIKEDAITTYIVPEYQKHFYCDQESTGVKTDTDCKNTSKSSGKRLFTLRDSFSSALGDFYNNTFKTVNYRWRYDMRKEDLEFIKDNADIVILEQVERYIPSLLSQSFPKE